MAKGEWQATTELVNAAVEILEAEHPMTLRQLFYRLVSVAALPNTRRAYQKLSRRMTKARDDGRCPWEYLVDRSRPEYTPNVFIDAAEYAESVKRAYRKDYWTTQPYHVEVWAEKDAVIGSIQDTTDELGITVRVGRGFLSTTNAHDISEHFCAIEKPITVFYLGDWDASGVCIESELYQRILSYGDGVYFNLERLAIHKEDIKKFNLPPLRIKDADPRATGFRMKHGEKCVELDALPPTELRKRVRDAVNGLVDWDLWDRAIAVEKAELTSIIDGMARWPGAKPPRPPRKNGRPKRKKKPPK